jgi:SNF2 family DNA or RNA helicase
VIYQPYQYQEYTTEQIIKLPACGLFEDMGLGKTVATLTAMDILINGLLEVNKPLVIAPKRVCHEVWPEEVQKWEHLRHLKLSLILGTEKERKEALQTKADIYIINRENVAWLVGYYGTAFPFDMVVIDELSSFKNPDSVRFKAFRKVRPKVKRLVGLTGTPMPNGFMDLWAQIFLLDMGERLGTSITHYRDRWFTKNNFQPFAKFESLKYKEDDADIIGQDYYEKKILELISDICISMKAEDYLDLPPVIDRLITVSLSKKVQAQYEEFEKKMVLAIDDIDEITAVNAGALTTKLLQFANGAVYDETGKYHEFHDEKLDALEEIVEDAAGHPVLIGYSFRHDKERIHKRLKKYKPVNIAEKGAYERWNKKQIPVMTLHPASGGHGLNLQAGGNIIIWFGLTNNLEWYLQLNKRLHRLGTVKPVIRHRLIARNTIDFEVLDGLDAKDSMQNVLMKALKVRIKKYR